MTENEPAEVPSGSALPLPIVEASGQEVWDKNTVDGDPDPTTPFGIACLFWQGLADPVEYRPALETMSLNPAAWGDYTQAATMIGDLSILTGTVFNEDREERDIAYIRFIEFGGEEAGLVFEDAAMPEFYALTVVKVPGDEWWRVWGLSENYLPGVDEIIKP